MYCYGRQCWFRCSCTTQQASVLQVTQALGRSVVRTIGYVENPGVTLQIIQEASVEAGALMLNDCELGADFLVRNSK
jgi:hypothetical protein